MEIRVKRVLVNDVREHDPVFRDCYILPETIFKIEQGVADKDRTTLLFSWGEEITIDEDIHKFKDRVDEYEEQKKLGL